MLLSWQIVKEGTSKGSGRFSEGVYIAGPAYEEGFAASHAVIERTNLMLPLEP